MKRGNLKILSAVLLSVLILGAFPATALAASPSDVIIGNSYTLESGQTLNNDLFVLGGSVNLKSGSTINGNVLLIGTSAIAAGTINGELTIFGGTLNLTATFVLNGDLTYAGTALTQDPAAQIKGQVNSNVNTPYVILPGGTRIPNLTTNIDPFFKVVGFFLRLFLWTLAAMLAGMFLPAHLARTSETVFKQPLISGGLGLLTIIILPILLVLLAITICLIPVSLLGALLLVLAWAFGLISLGLEVGKRISVVSKREWHPAIAAGLGTLLLMTVLSGLETLIPCVGWIPKVVVGIFGLGAVLLTQFGMKSYSGSLSSATGSPTTIQPS